jgi:enoyl-CoA hydratase
MENAVLLEIKDGIAFITLNRPERHNAINRALLTGLMDSIKKAAEADEARVVIITGAGKSFCSGVDLKFAAEENLFGLIIEGPDLPDVFAACNKPIIGAVNGNAITGGFEIALNCDFLIASEKAMFRDTHAKLGIHPGWGMTQLLQHTVGQRMAKQISLACQPVTAQKALEIGLVNEVVSHEELLPRAIQIAKDISETNQDMRLIVKGLIEYRNRATFDDAFAHERSEFRGFAGKLFSSKKQ